MDPESQFPGFELSGDFLTITAPGISLKIATWIAKEFDADKTPDSRFVWLGDGVCIPTSLFLHVLYKGSLRISEPRVYQIRRARSTLWFEGQ